MQGSNFGRGIHASFSYRNGMPSTDCVPVLCDIFAEPSHILVLNEIHSLSANLFVAMLRENLEAVFRAIVSSVYAATFREKSRMSMHKASVDTERSRGPIPQTKHLTKLAFGFRDRDTWQCSN